MEKGHQTAHGYYHYNGSTAVYQLLFATVCVCVCVWCVCPGQPRLHPLVTSLSNGFI